MLVGYKAIADNYQKAIDEGENSGHHIDDDFAIQTYRQEVADYFNQLDEDSRQIGDRVVLLIIGGK